VVLVTHRPRLLETADTLLVLKNGRIDYHGAPEAQAPVLPAAIA
jgi:ABC-type protease/lipase transport system fused ATPase/permease subunit